jgi:hypothetical protein
MIKRQDHYRNLVETIVEKYHDTHLDRSTSAEVLLPDVKLDMLFDIPKEKIVNPKSPFTNLLQEVNIFHIKAFNDRLTSDDVKQYIGELYITAVSSICKRKKIAGKIVEKKSVGLTIISAESVAKNMVSGLHCIEETDIPWIYSIRALGIAYIFVIDEIPDSSEFYHLFMPFRSPAKLIAEKSRIFEISRNITDNSEFLLAMFWLNKLQPEVYKELNMTVDMKEIVEQLCPDALKQNRLEGKIEGKEEGRSEREKEIAINLLKQGMEVAFVVTVTGLDNSEVLAIQSDLNKGKL